MTTVDSSKTPMDEATKIETFKKSRIFRELPLDALREMARISRPVRVSKGEIIFADGDSAEAWNIIHKGLVKLYKGSPTGRNLTITVATDGETLNGIAMSLDEYFMTAQAMSDLVVLRISRTDFLAFVEHYPIVANHMVAVLAKRLNRDYDRLVDVIGERIENRIAHSLALLAQKFGTRLSLTREELAEFAGTTTETTIRVLSKLKREGIIGSAPSRGEIVIVDMAKLKDYDPF